MVKLSLEWRGRIQKNLKGNTWIGTGMYLECIWRQVFMYIGEPSNVGNVGALKF
jgi:hypothetical protein